MSSKLNLPKKLNCGIQNKMNIKINRLQNEITLIKDSLEQTEKLLKLITENALDTILITDVEGIIQYATAAHKNMLEYDPDFLIGKIIYEFVHPEEQEKVYKQFHQLVNKGGEKSMVYRYRHAHGYYIWLETEGKCIQENGNINGIIFCSRDVTMRINAEQSLFEKVIPYCNINTGLKFFDSII